MSKPAQRGGRRAQSTGSSAGPSTGTSGASKSTSPKKTSATKPPARLPDPTLEGVNIRTPYPAKIGRIPVVELAPVIDGGRWSAKATVGEAIPIEATVFREGHDAFGATAVLLRPDGTVHSRTPMVDVSPGNDRYRGWVIADSPGQWSFRVEGWSDPYATWKHEASVKIPAEIDVELVLAEGALVLDRASQAAGLDAELAGHLIAGASGLRDTTRPAQARLAAGTSAQVVRALATHPLREEVSPSAAHELGVDRPRALAGSWYEFFPRSEGAYFDPELGTWKSGTLRTASERLEGIAAMGFDFVYLTPIHPIGATFRKGRNNTLRAEDGDPGSPYAIGSPDGGHDAIEPTLGTFEDFDAFAGRARELDLEVAIDLALQCSPDHPWVTEHPQWFTTRADGTIAYAENPPKKYQDIYPLNFDNDPEGIYQEVLRILRLWISHGVTAFRVDNPHTKPLPFWERIIAEIAATSPGVLFLAEAFTRPAMMRTLGSIGFHQSYTYFTWRNTKDELAEYLHEVSEVTPSQMRPSFWPTTHDILTPYMQTGGAAAFAIRAIVAATGSPTWGVYSGYEFAERTARPGAEEQIDNEKYEFRPRDWTQANQFGLVDLITSLNSIRRDHPSLQRLHGLVIHPTTDDATLCFSRSVSAEHSPTGNSDTIVVVVNLDPHTTRESMIFLDLAALGMDASQGLVATDLLTGESFSWGAENFVRLDPAQRSGHVLQLTAPVN